MAAGDKLTAIPVNGSTTDPSTASVATVKLPVDVPEIDGVNSTDTLHVVPAAIGLEELQSSEETVNSAVAFTATIPSGAAEALVTETA